MIDSRKIIDLAPPVLQKCYDFVAECKRQRLDVIITSTFRDNECQQFLYAQGRTRPGPKVTNAMPGQSFHNYRVAFDFLPILNGKAQWQNEDLFKQCGLIAERLGLEWAGRCDSFPELCHCQFTQGHTIHDYQDSAHKLGQLQALRLPPVSEP